jgi:hypothetical protein
VTQDTAAFFTLDRGTVSTLATLISPVEGRYRMLASAAAPVALDPESVLEDLAWRVARTDPSVAGSMEGWRSWSRLEVHSGRAPRAVLVAAGPETGALLERAFAGAGWAISARFFAPAPDHVALGEALLELELDAVVVGSRNGVSEEEADAARLLWPRTAALARFRDDLAVIACGPFIDRPEGIVEGRLFALPAPDKVPLTTETQLRQAAGQVGSHLANRRQPVPADARASLRAAIGSLAAVLDQRVEGLEIGAAAGSRTLAGPDGEQRHAVTAAAGMLRPELLQDDDLAEETLRWSTLAGDPAGRMDALREMVLRPWGTIDPDGAHLRLAALRAALERLEAAWPALEPGMPDDTATVRVLAGGAWAGLPSTAATLALADAIRRPGAASVLHDHAGVLAPLGALPVEADRRRLLADLLGDCLLPLGATLMTGPLGSRGKGKARLSVRSMMGEQTLELEPGTLELVDVPPGVVAQLELDPLDGSVLGSQGRPLSLEVRGGLSGLLVDARPVPLVLPDAGEPRRAQLDAWEAPAWTGREA